MHYKTTKCFIKKKEKEKRKILQAKGSLVFHSALKSFEDVGVQTRVRPATTSSEAVENQQHLNPMGKGPPRRSLDPIYREKLKQAGNTQQL